VHERRRDLWFLGFLFLACVVANLLRWRAVQVGLMSDDFMQQGMIDGIYPGGDTYVPFDLYAFLRHDVMIAHVEQGTAPWWSIEELHGTVLRPLASLLLWLDRSLLPGHVALWHAHSMLWFAGAIVALGLAVDRLLPRSIAILAVALFVCEAGVISPLTWLANRCVLLCATFGFLAIWAHLEWRSPRASTPAWRRRHGALLVGVLMTACIASGEYGLGILAYLGAWELLLGPGNARARLRALLPALVPVIVYLFIHKLRGYGTSGAEVYADPFHTPLGYLDWASKRVPQLSSAAFWSIPAATINVYRFGLMRNREQWWMPEGPTPDEFHQGHINMSLGGVALACVTVALARRAWTHEERGALRVLLLGGLLGLLPISVAPAHSRLLVVAQLAVCPLIAAVIIGCGRLLLGRASPIPSSNLPGSSMASRVRGAVLLPIAGLLAWQHTLGDIRWGNSYLRYLDALQASNMIAFTAGDLLKDDLSGRDVIIVNGPSQSVGLFGAFVLHTADLPTPRSWRPLTIGSNFASVANRPAANTLVVSTVQGAWLRNAGELFFRREDQPLRTGDVLTYPSLSAEVLRDDDGHPTSVRFVFDRNLDDPSLVFVVATERGIMRWNVPPVKGRNVIPLPKLPPVPEAESIHGLLP
jgi:hypothetical protein